MTKTTMKQLIKEIGEIVKQFMFGKISGLRFRKLLLYPTELRGPEYLPHTHLYSFLTIHHQSQVHVT